MVSSQEDIVPAAIKLDGRNYEQWLDITLRFEITPIDGLIPAHTFFLVSDDNKILGAINIRHYLNEYLEKFSGHIGYGVRPSERNKGYAEQMLSMSIPIAKDLGIKKYC